MGESVGDKTRKISPTHSGLDAVHLGDDTSSSSLTSISGRSVAVKPRDQRWRRTEHLRGRGDHSRLDHRQGRTLITNRKHV